MQQGGKLYKIFGARAGHVRKRQVEALEIPKWVGLEEPSQVIVLGKEEYYFAVRDEYVT